MSYKHRQRKREAAALAMEHEFYEAPSGNQQAWSGETDSDNYSAEFPGPRESFFADAENFIPDSQALDSVRDNVDWDVGGLVGATKNVGSTGVTDPQTVGSTWYGGEMAVIRRMSPNMEGPTAGQDHNSMLALLYEMQESAHYFPNDFSQVDVIRAV